MDKDREMLEKVQKNKKLLGAAGMILIVIGGAIVLIAALPLGIYPEMMDEEHITDDSIPIRDMDNVTYTYEKEWFDQKEEDARYYVLAGCIPVAAGYALLLATGAFVDDRKNHRMHCDGTGEKRYCPECGLKLSRLEKD